LEPVQDELEPEPPPVVLRPAGPGGGQHGRVVGGASGELLAQRARPRPRRPRLRARHGRGERVARVRAQQEHGVHLLTTGETRLGEHRDRALDPRDLARAHHAIAHRRLRQPGVAQPVLAQQPGPLFDPRPPAGAGQHRRFADRGLDRDRDQLRLAGHVPVQRHLRDAEGVGHALHGHRPQAVGVGDPHGRVRDRGEGQRRPRPAGGSARRSPEQLDNPSGLVAHPFSDPLLPPRRRCRKQYPIDTVYSGHSTRTAGASTGRVVHDTGPPRSVPRRRAVFIPDPTGGGTMGSIKSGLFISLDGVIEAPETWHFDYWNDEMGAAVGALMEGGDAMLLGRTTCEGLAGHWPTADPDDPMTKQMNSARKYVVSNTLTEATWENSTIVSGDVKAELT